MNDTIEAFAARLLEVNKKTKKGLRRWKARLR